MALFDCHSYDDGNSWQDDSLISYFPRQNTGGLIGPATGLQASDGTIYFNTRDYNDRHWIYWSNDYGKSWNSTRDTVKANECSIAFLESADDGRILMNCRTCAGCGRSQWVWTKDAPGPKEEMTSIPNPNCQGSIVNDGQHGKRGSLWFSNPASDSDREKMTVRRSPQASDGKTWGGGKLMYDGPSGYSQLVPMAGGKIGILFESNDKGKNYKGGPLVFSSFST